MAKKHDYKALASRAFELTAQGATANAASETVAKQVDLENWDSVARSIRRYLRVPARAPEIPTARAGLGVLYVLIRERLKGIREECISLLQTSRQYDFATRKVGLIRDILEARLAELKALSAPEAVTEVRSLLRGLDEADPELMDPAAIIAREISDLKNLIEIADQLQDAIDIWREGEL